MNVWRGTIHWLWLAKPRQAFEVTAARTSEWVNHVFSHQTDLRVRESVYWQTDGHNWAHCTKGLKPYQSSMQRMLSEDLSRLEQSFSSASKWCKRQQALLARCWFRGGNCRFWSQLGCWGGKKLTVFIPVRERIIYIKQTKRRDTVLNITFDVDIYSTMKR